MLRTILFLLISLWLVGFLLHIAGAFIHILLGLAVVVLLFDIFTRRSSAT